MSLWVIATAAAVVVVTRTKAQGPTRSFTNWAPRTQASHGLLVHDRFDQGRSGQHTQTRCQLSQNDQTHFRPIGHEPHREREREREREEEEEEEEEAESFFFFFWGWH